MNVALLIDAIVRQTMVLIAELATSRGLRAPLAHMADQVFLEMARQLDSQGLSRKVSADMFGMALRTYQRKVQRLQESETERRQTLWEAVHGFVRSRPMASRKEILERFRDDEEAVVRGVLTDLVESGLVFATGSSMETSFRAVSDAELGAMARNDSSSDELIWAIVFRTGPTTASALSLLSRSERDIVDAALERLVAAERIERAEADPEPLFRTTRLVIPMGAPSGWEAAVFDHYHAVVGMLCAKLRLTTTAQADDTVGGSTYGLEVWEGHPLEGEVLGTLARLRTELSGLRERVRVYNRTGQKPSISRGVVLYVGQSHAELNDEDVDQG